MYQTESINLPRAFLLTLILPILTLSCHATEIIRDDFDDGMLGEEWGLSDPYFLSGQADPMEITFEDGALKLCGPNWMPGASLVGIYWKDVDFKDFYLAVDVLGWESPGNNRAGLFARTSGLENVGSPADSGFWATIDHARGSNGTSPVGLRLSEIAANPSIDEISEFEPDPEQAYRLVFVGEGDKLTTAVYHLEDLTRPIHLITVNSANGPANGKVGFASFSGFKTGATIDNFLAAESDPYADLLPEGATAHGVEGAAQVIAKSPGTGAEPIDAVEGIQFTVSTLTDKAVDPSSIRLILNGEDVSVDLTTTPDGNNLTVRYDGLQPNQIYEGSLTMTNVDGVGSTHRFAFETTDVPLPSVVVREDFEDGSIDNDLVVSDYLNRNGLADAMKVTFPDGGVHLQPQAPNSGTYGGAGGLITKGEYSDFYAAVDLLDWGSAGDPTTEIHLIARLQDEQEGPRDIDGYSFTWLVGGGFPVLLLGEINNTGRGGNRIFESSRIQPNPGQQYRMVFRGEGRMLFAELYDLVDLTTPLVSFSTNQGSKYSSGQVGIYVGDNNDFAAKSADATFDNFVVAESNPYADLLPEGATAYGVEGTAQVIEKSPTTGAEPIDAIEGLQFTVSTLTDKEIDPSSTMLTLNGADVSSALTIIPDGNDFIVRYDDLQPNQSYQGTLSVANIDGVGTTHAFSFATTDTPLPEVAIPSIEIAKSEDATVTVSWTETSGVIGYSLYASETMEPGSWKPAGDARIWPTDGLSWTANTEGASEQYYQLRVMAQQERGALLHAEPVGENAGKRSAEEISQQLAIHAGSDLFEHRFGAQLWRVVYQTVNWDGEPALASGLVTLPVGAEGARPFGAFLHGTRSHRERSPSFTSGFDVSADGSLAMATMGYVGIDPDYIGLGVSTRFHPYIHAESEANAVVDCLRAARALCQDNGVVLDNRVALMGYSQGGHVTIATHQMLETHYADEFEVIASAPGAGPLVISETIKDTITAGEPYPFPAVLLKLLLAYGEIYDLFDDPGEVLREPWASQRDLFLLSESFQGDLAVAAPVETPLTDFLQPAFVEAYANDPDHPLRKALEENDVIDWTPTAPIRLFHCPDDRWVDFKHATLARDAFLANGATDVEIIEPAKAGFPGVSGHNACADPALSLAFDWLEAFVASKE